MKTFALALCLGLGFLATVQVASAHEIKCRFDNKSGCEVTIREDVLSAPVCGTVELRVKCDDTFELRDDAAVIFNRSGQLVVVGTDKSDLAAVQFDANAFDNDVHADLTISSERPEEATRLDGRCKIGDGG